MDRLKASYEEAVKTVIKFSRLKASAFFIIILLFYSFYIEKQIKYFKCPVKFFFYKQ